MSGNIGKAEEAEGNGETQIQGEVTEQAGENEQKDETATENRKDDERNKAAGANEEEQGNKDVIDDGKLHRIHVDYCPKCRVPFGYCQFFGHVRQPEEEEAHEEEMESAQQNMDERPNVIIKMIMKGRKSPKKTTLCNSALWGVDAKELSKMIKKNLSTGCSKKTKDDGVLVFHGDVEEVLTDLLVNKWKIPPNRIEKTVVRIQTRKELAETVRQPLPQPQFNLDEDVDQEEELKRQFFASREYSDDDDEL